MKFTVTTTATVYRTYEIEASSLSEAQDMVEDSNSYAELPDDACVDCQESDEEVVR